MHLVGVVDGPHVDLQALAVGVADQPAVDEGDAGLAYRNLEAVGDRAPRGYPQAGQADPAHSQGPGRRAELWAEEGAASCETPIRE